MPTRTDQRPVAGPAPFDLSRLDVDRLVRDLDAVRATAEATLDHEDFLHLRRVERWGRACSIAGYATAWIAPNPLSALLISQGNVVRWTILMHHIGHRGMDHVPGVPERYTSKRFAAGARRFVDWLDWIDPEAWRHEHNVLHHYHTGDREDPDLVEDNARSIRESSLPLALKYAAVAFYACTWKVTYYAPSTFQSLLDARRRRAGAEPAAETHYFQAFDPRTREGRELWRRALLPYGLTRFLAIPALFAPLGPLAVASVFANSVLAEVFTNAHTFAIIAPNHAGGDVYRFEGRPRDRGEFYVRQVLGSVNYTGGTELSDFFQGYLNYQIEHHLFPDLPPRKYREIQPRVREICREHGLPYVEESVFRRLGKLVEVMVGKASMRRAPPLARAPRANAPLAAAERASPGPA